MDTVAKALHVRHRAEQAAARLPPLMVHAERIAATVAQGVHGRRRVGQGETFWQFRRYEPGDAIQSIDWRQSAKTEHLFVRETEWEAAQSVWLWRDGSGSMRYRSDRNLPEKSERSDILLLAMASLLVRGGERVTLLDGSRPASGRAALENLALKLTIDVGTNNPLADSLPPFMALPRHGQLVLFGDFLSPLEDIEARFRRFAAQGVKAYVMQVLDPAEETLPFRGRTRFEGLEDEGRVLVKRVETVREDYHGRINNHIDGLRGLCRRIGWSYGLHRTDHSPESALLTAYMALSALLAR
ncbi:MAG TPA: DUF58 domain-containing protein [Alphaproteobacteria bacterium]|nr:DUF58 domain-containing protein [Alphaproteobacteria bacterium]